MTRKADDSARRELEHHALRLTREIQQIRGRSASIRMSALISLAESRGVPLSEVLEAADNNTLDSIVRMPDKRTSIATAKARKARLDAMRRNWS